MDKSPNTWHPDTLLSHGSGIDPHTGAVVPPLQPSTTYARDDELNLIGGDSLYTRTRNATDNTAERLLAELEGAADARLFASGMAAAAALLHTLGPGAHILAPKVMYWSLRNWLRSQCDQWGMHLHFFDAAAPDDLERQLHTQPVQMLWLESPCNPTWDVIDIPAAVVAAKACGARVVVDNTVNTPLLCQPLKMGADYVFHSATKSLNGHSDVLAGAALCREADETWDKVINNRSNFGGVLGPFESWLLARGLRTLHLRVARACENAQHFAEHFESHPQILQVLYPGLPSHPGHALAAEQMPNGFGHMLSLRIRGGEQAARAVMSRLKLFVRATSLGGTESLIEHRKPIEGPDSPIADDLLRVSIGCEAVEDLIVDMQQALAMGLS